MPLKMHQRQDNVAGALSKLAALSNDGLAFAVANFDSPNHVPDMAAVEAVSNELREECLKFVALEHPVASNLKFAMVGLRVGHDYERIFELARSLCKRVNESLKSIPEAVPLKTAASEVLSMGKIIAQCHFIMSADAWRIAKVASDECVKMTNTLLATAQSSIKEMMDNQSIPAETKVDLVLAARHIKRIVALMEDIMEEWQTVCASEGN